MPKINQTSFERVTRLIILPLGDLFGLKLDEKIQEALLEDLALYSEEVLEKAMRDVRQKHEKLPFNPIAIFVKACDLYKPYGSSSRFTDAPPAWEEKIRRQKEMVEEYCRGLSATTQGAQARGEGWYSELEAYTREVARIQAGLILVVNTGFNSGIIYPDCRGSLPPRQREKDFWRDIHQQKRAGFIDVVVPQACIDAWRESVRQKRARNIPIEENSTRDHLAHALPLTESLDALGGMYE